MRLLFCLIVSSTLWFAGCATYSGKDYAAKSKLNYERAYQDYITLGAQYIERGRYDLAEPKIKRAIEIDPAPPEAWNMLAVLYEETRDIAASDQIYKKLISSHPDYTLGFMNYATFLCKFSRDLEAQVLYAQMRVKGGEFIPLSYIAEGNCQAEKNPMSAEAAYRQALHYDNRAAGALIPLARLSLQRDSYQTAINYLNVVHTYVGYSPESVYIGVLAARGLGHARMEDELMRIMRNNYANTAQARMLGI